MNRASKGYNVITAQLTCHRIAWATCTCADTSPHCL